VRTKVEELPESRVRLEIEVPEEDVKHALEHAASDLAGSLRIPGFRKGKVPTRVVAARLGRDALWQEAVRSHLDGWFWTAAQSSGIRPVASPQVEAEELPPAEGDPFRFTATVAVAPTPEVADWADLEVASPEPEVPAELVDAELERLRATVAELSPVEGRPAQPGDTVVLDLAGDDAGTTQKDYVVEIGSSRLLDEIELALVGLSPGETKAVEFELADGKRATVDVVVKEVKEKVLPPLDDELAKAASQFETLAELRADLEALLREQLEAELEAKFREDAVDALAARTEIDGVQPLVERRTADLATGLVRSLESRGIPFESFLVMTGQDEQQVVERLRGEAEQSLRRELVLEAVAEKLGLEISDDEVEAVIREQAEEAGDDSDEVVGAIRESAGFEQLRGDLRLRKALDEVVGGVKRIPVELARAREKLWTPEKKEKAGAKMNIWTPGSEEPK
jgi:trigger factor